MKKTKITQLALSGTAVVLVGLAIIAPNLKGNAESTDNPANVSTTDLSSSSEKIENPTIAYFLTKYPTKADFENWLNISNSRGSNYVDNSYVIKDRTSGDDGYIVLSPEDEGGSKVIDGKTGKVLDSYTRSDSTGATIAQIRAAYK